MTEHSHEPVLLRWWNSLLTLRYRTALQWVPALFAVWLMLTVLGPHKAHYRIFFHIFIYTLTLYLLVKGRTNINWRDPFLLLFVVFCLYMGISTMFVGDVPLSDDLRKFRWGFEAALGMIAFFIWMPNVLKHPVCWGRYLLWLTILGASGGFVISIFGTSWDGRLVGLGAMYNPIQASSILLAFFAIGHFLLTNSPGPRKSYHKDMLLAAIALTSIIVFTFFSESRAPIIALCAYLSFLGLLTLIGHGHRRLFLAIVATTLLGVLILYLSTDFPSLIHSLIERGESHRLGIWKGYLSYPPESLLFGNGAGMNPEYTRAAQEFWIPNHLLVTHTHNIWLGAYVETGLLGLAMQCGLLALITLSTLRLSAPWREKWNLLGLIGLFLMLTFTSEHTLIPSMKPIWIFGWTLLVFTWFWTRYLQNHRTREEAA